VIAAKNGIDTETRFSTDDSPLLFAVLLVYRTALS
jgi:hypothetical protein